MDNVVEWACGQGAQRGVRNPASENVHKPRRAAEHSLRRPKGRVRRVDEPQVQLAFVVKARLRERFGIALEHCEPEAAIGEFERGARAENSCPEYRYRHVVVGYRAVTRTSSLSYCGPTGERRHD